LVRREIFGYVMSVHCVLIKSGPLNKLL